MLPMMLTPEEVEEFRLLYLAETGNKLSPADAAEAAQNLVATLHLAISVIRPTGDQTVHRNAVDRRP